MKRNIFILVFIILLSACSTVPFTGRKQFKMLPAAEMNAMALENYGTFLKENKLSSNKNQVALLQKVGNKIKIAVEKYLTAHGQQKIIDGFNWEFNLIENPSVNAWAMPGGKIVFYTGIMDVCEDETGIAVVMSHEIAHIIASHGNERMSQALFAQFGGVALNVLIKEKPQETKNLYIAAFGIGTQFGVMLPYSRTHEYEADKIGLIFMVMAGYNPEAGVDFWTRMSALSKGHAPPEFLSTHPTPQNRIQAMKDFLPEARTYAK